MNIKNTYFFLFIILLVPFILLVTNENNNSSNLSSFLVYESDIKRKKIGYIVDEGYEEIIINKNIKSKTPNKLYEITNPNWPLFFGLIKKHFYPSKCLIDCDYAIMLNNNNDYLNYTDKSGVSYSGSNKDEYSFGVIFEENRPQSCSEKDLPMKKNNCYDYDTLAINSAYLSKINNFLNELNFDYEYEITDKFIEHSNTFNYNIKFIIDNNSVDNGWFFDFGPNGAYSLKGFYLENIEKNIDKFSFISLNKAIKYYKNNNYLYNLIPNLVKDNETYIKNDNNILYISNVEISYRKNIYNEKLYIFPYYKLTTDKGVYYLLAIEEKKYDNNNQKRKV